MTGKASWGSTEGEECFLTLAEEVRCKKDDAGGQSREDHFRRSFTGNSLKDLSAVWNVLGKHSIP